MNPTLSKHRLERWHTAENTLQNITAIISTHNQRTSPLLRLPAELRNIIYTFLFSSLPILICFATSHATRAIDPCPLAPSEQRRLSHMHYSRLLLSLTEVCWQTYAEARLLPFVLNTFMGYPEAVLSAFPGRFWRGQVECVSRIQIMVQRRDIGEGRYGRERGERRGVSTDMGMVLEVLLGLPALRTLRVVWEGDASDLVLWEGFLEELSSRLGAAGRASVEIV